ncbi:Lsr2 family DNA-binding protein [Streptomyces sp. NPDC003444]
MPYPKNYAGNCMTNCGAKATRWVDIERYGDKRFVSWPHCYDCAARRVGEEGVTTRPLGEPDPELVMAFMVVERLREPGDPLPVTPPEIRLFNRRYLPYLKSKQDEKEERERRELMDRRAAEARERRAHQAWLMRDMRKWGPENGFFVGTRGRIPRKVIEAYNKAKGITS